MIEENEKFASLVEYYAAKIKRLKTPLTEEEKQLIEKLGRSLMKRQMPKRIKFLREKREKRQTNEKEIEM